jgi:hypothetical protein
MPRINKKLKGGNATSMPIEYFGGNSGRFSTESFSNPGSFAYGDYTPQSFGEPFQGDMSGPNMGVYPNSTNLLTGGRRKKRSLRRRVSKRTGKSVSKRGKRSRRRTTKRSGRSKRSRRQ